MLIMTTETLIEFRIILITLRCSYDVVRVERKKGRRRRTALTVKEKKTIVNRHYEELRTRRTRPKAEHEPKQRLLC